jgi:hypothetical protein
MGERKSRRRSEESIGSRGDAGLLRIASGKHAPGGMGSARRGKRGKRKRVSELTLVSSPRNNRGRSDGEF